MNKLLMLLIATLEAEKIHHHASSLKFLNNLEVELHSIVILKPMSLQNQFLNSSTLNWIGNSKLKKISQEIGIRKFNQQNLKGFHRKNPDQLETLKHGLKQSKCILQILKPWLQPLRKLMQQGNSYSDQIQVEGLKTSSLMTELWWIIMDSTI